MLPRVFVCAQPMLRELLPAGLYKLPMPAWWRMPLVLHTLLGLPKRLRLHLLCRAPNGCLHQLRAAERELPNKLRLNVEWLRCYVRFVEQYDPSSSRCFVQFPHLRSAAAPRARDG